MTIKDHKIIDVRTPAEYTLGHVPGSINIPLLEVIDRIEEIRAIQEPIIVCCASGIRSAQAVSILGGQGIDCKDGGSWKEVFDNF